MKKACGISTIFCVNPWIAPPEKPPDSALQAIA
jgi:hypothetical protein